MKNLIPYVISRLKTDEEIPLPLQKFVFCEELVVACFCTSGMAAVALWSPSLFWHDHVEWPLSGPDSSVVGLHYDSLDKKAVIVFGNGEFVEVCNGDAAVVGSLGTSVAACEWSPSGELAAAVCESGKVIILSTDFTLGEDVMVGEHEMTSSDLQLAESHVSVGWGKRETQFQGRGARALSKDPTISNEVASRDPDVHDKGQVTVSWRGDGEYVVVNSLVDGKRALRVFSHEGKLESVSEPCNKMLGLVAYEPRGALIATVTGAGELQFFERNGLKRYSFIIENSHEVKQLAWSSDSTVLSICYENKVDLWTQKNWHWYRKQCIEENFECVEWHPEMPRTLGLCSRDGITFSTWHFATASDQGLVAVIDTNEVLVTPLAVAGMPPPMSFATFTFTSQPCAVAVTAPSRVAVALKDEVIVLDLDLENAVLNPVSKHSVGGVQRLAFASTLIGYLPQSNEVVDIETGRSLAEPAVPVSVLKPFHYMCGSQVFSLEGGHLVAEFREPCTDIVVASNDQCFGLTRTGKLLHSSGKTLGHGVTSMLRGPDHLLFTTLTTLQFVHLHQQQQLDSQPQPQPVQAAGLQNKSSTPIRHTEQSREIERGSQLVTVMSDAMAVVLQAPRGNIETIYPRMLVLGVVRDAVSKLNYSDAFYACKAHRIDMNVLYDLNPEQWKANIDEFVSQLGSDNNIDLFLSSLSDEVVTETKYVDTSKTMIGGAGAPLTAASGTHPGKANLVLDLISSHVSPVCRITALAMKQPPALVEALTQASHSPELVKHLVFLNDSYVLYKVALSNYEPKLALVVAQQAQMDPKEYLPFLRARDAESEHRSKYNIDLFLRRVDRAVEHLIADPDASSREISDFVLKHDLQALALSIMRRDDSQLELRREAFDTILLSQAETWLAQSRYIDAGTNFELLGDVNRARDAYIQGCSWKRALALPLDNEEQRRKVVEQVVDTCEANKLYGDCAYLLLHFLNEPRRALELFCQADRFDDAILVAAINPSLKDVLSEQLRESFGLYQELLSDCKTQIPAQLRRLRAIRAKRQEDILGFDKLANQLESTGLDVADNLSLAGTEMSGTTNASAYTRYTDKSSVGTAATNATRRTLKNQRRQDRKKARGKKGSVYEEDYLIASTTRLVERLKSIRSELQELVTALRRCDLSVYAAQLTTAYQNVIDLLVENLDEIFTVEEEALIRFDESGHEYVAPSPIKPDLPSLLDV